MTKSLADNWQMAKKIIISLSPFTDNRTCCPAPYPLIRRSRRNEYLEDMVRVKVVENSSNS